MQLEQKNQQETLKNTKLINPEDVGLIEGLDSLEGEEKINDVGKEGLQNITNEMIKEPPFEAVWFGHQISGEFKGVKYSWNYIGLPNKSGIRGTKKGTIITESGKEFSNMYPRKLENIDEIKPCV